MAEIGKTLLFRTVRLSQPLWTRNHLVCKIHRPFVQRFANKALWSRGYCASNFPYEKEETPVVFKNGFPTINVMLPSKDERCLFTLRPLTDTVGSFLNMVSEEDGGIETISVYRKDGTKIAKATNIDILLSDDFDLLINSRRFSVTPPKIEVDGSDEKNVAQVKDLISQLYTQMNLSEWQASREKELIHSIENIKHELAPYEQLRLEMIQSSEKRTERLKWMGLTLMGVQFGFLARLTWWEYSWDIMEPVTYFVTYGTSMAMMAYYLLSRQEFAYPDVRDRAFLIHLHKQAKKKAYDVDHFNSLMVKLDNAENDLQKVRQPLGLTMPEKELQSILTGKESSV